MAPRVSVLPLVIAAVLVASVPGSQADACEFAPSGPLRLANPFEAALARPFDAGAHRGWSFESKRGEPVRAAASGMVTTVRHADHGGSLVVVSHGGGFETIYGQLRRTAVQPGQCVERERVIGISGGESSPASRFYFEIRKDGESLDPAGFLRPELPARGQRLRL